MLPFLYVSNAYLITYFVQKGVHSSRSLKSLSLNMKDEMASDSYFNFYRNAFRNDPLFGKVGNGGTFADVYAHKVVGDALAVGTDVDLAYEAAVSMSIWMQVVHHLETAVKRCGDTKSAMTAGLSVDAALAYYVGVSQTKGDTDGYLLYSFAQKTANLFKTVEAVTGEAKANVEVNFGLLPPISNNKATQLMKQLLRFLNIEGVPTQRSEQMQKRKRSVP